jgi:hypothetical protein
VPRVDEICSIDLLGRKMFAPCDPSAYLSVQYGKNFYEPSTSQGYSNAHIYGQWSENEWLHAIRDYTKDGILDVNKTLDLLNKWNPRANSTIITDLPAYE